MSGTHSPAEWASAGCAGLSAISLICLAMAFADADLAYFDPRPLLGVARDRVLVGAVNVRLDVREMAAETGLYVRLSLRELAVSAAALLALLTINPGATR